VIDTESDQRSKSDGTGAKQPADQASDQKETDSSNGKNGKLGGASDKEPNATPTATGAGTALQTEAASHATEANPDAMSGDRNEAGANASSGAQPHNAGSTTTAAEDIEIPVFEVDELAADGVLIEEAQAVQKGRTHPVTGIWEQIAGPNTSDFAPGGYQRSVIALNPANKSVSVYRIFRGDVATVVGGELALDCETNPASRAEGTLAVRPDPSRNSKFRTTPLPLGGNPPVTIEPPSGSGPWNLQWKRERVELVVGEKRYTAITREAFDKIRAGGGDVATEADRAERIPDPVPGARSITLKQTSFFGVRGGGKRICFVVDMSGSMQGPKFDRLKQELTQAIQGFKPEQLFSVAFFHGAPELLDQAWMRNDRDGARAVQLIAQQGTGGGTDPTGAFQFAFQNLSPVPDCIFFMTDGQIPPNTPDLLRSLNNGAQKTVIHAINFGEPASEVIMKQIAQENTGTYTFVQP
jgi:hypothetical protein